MKTKKHAIMLCAGALAMLTACGDTSDYSKYVTLGSLEHLQKNLTVETVDEQSMADAKEEALADYTEYEDATGRIKEGQMADVSIVVTSDGEELYDFSDEPYEMTVGKEEFGAEFDTYLIGKEAGDAIDIEVSYDSSFDDGVLCGKTVEIKGSVAGIKDVVMPEVDDAFVKENFGFSTVQEWEEQLRADIEEQKQQEAQEMMREDLLQQAIDASDISGYPKNLYKQKLQEVKDGYQSYADMFGCDVSEVYDTFGLTEEDIEKEALDNVEMTMVVSMIAQKEDLMLTDEELQQKKEAYAAEQEYDSVEDLLEDYEETGLEEYFLQEKVKDYLESVAQ
ncbi:MAG: hypothetical protein SO019_07575 [Lachnospiraceae bacterium]|nr:hypothetical protein [Lachnospiraceae bacterium]